MGERAKDRTQGFWGLSLKKCILHSMAKQLAIELAHLTKKFSDFSAVSDVSLTIEKGEIVGFVGPNGAGKTTTISMLLGFIRPTSGSVQIFDTSILPETAHKTHGRIGYVAGDMALPSGLTGRQYIDFTANQFGRDWGTYEALVKKIAPVLNKRIKTLSRGNKQKLALVAALQHKPELLVLDEPTSGLDPLMQDVFLSAVQQASRQGTTVFMSSHILSEVADICERVLFMKHGEIIIDKPVRDIEAQSGKRISIGYNPKSFPEIGLLDGVTIVSKKPSLVFRYDGDMPLLTRWLAKQSVTDVSIINRELDDVFRDLYNETKDAK